MHYKIGSQIVIKTENAAKPAAQASSHLKQILASLPPVDASFDYGCGKLRYYQVLLKRTNTLTLVDSEVQLSRLQMIGGKQISIRKSVSGSNRVSVYNEREFRGLSAQFDRGFCINVLSVIPIYSVRRHVLETIRSV